MRRIRSAGIVRRFCGCKLKGPIFEFISSSFFHSLGDPFGRQTIADNAIHSLADHPLPGISQFPQKGFSEISDPVVGRAVHAVMVKSFFTPGIIHFNTLVNMYVRFGDLDAARNVFDGIPLKNQASWSTMVSGYVKLGLFCSATGLFREMHGHGVLPNGFMVASLVTTCTRSGKMFVQGIEIHGLVVKIGLLDDVYVSSAFVHFYAEYACLDSAKQVFDEMAECNIVSWTSLMFGYLKNSDPEKSMEIYRQMKRKGVVFNPNSFSTVISACALLEDKFLGAQVLAHVMHSGFNSNTSVANSLIHMFGNFGSMEDASYVFTTMEEVDKISWNSIISVYARNGFSKASLEYFNVMRWGGEEPDSTTFSSLISACSSVDDQKLGKGVHGLVIKFGFDAFVCVNNTLITMYSMLGESSSADIIFYLIPDKDLVSWNSLMSSFVQNERHEEVINLLIELLGTRKEINDVTFSCAMAACATPEAFDVGKMVHALVLVHGLDRNLLVGNSLITMYSKCGAMEQAKRVFETMSETDVVTWNALIGGYAESEWKERAIGVFNLMRELNFKTNYITMVGVLSACSVTEDLLKYGMPIHAHIVLCGFESDAYVKNSLLTMYAKCGDPISSNFLFHQLDMKMAVSWNAIIAANAHQGHGEEALKLFLQMHREGLELDQFSLSAGLAATASLALLEEGQQLHDLIIKLGFEADLHVTNAIMDMYGKCGTMENIIKVVPNTRKRTRLTWNVLISAYARHGLFLKAKEAFEEMMEVGVRPDYVTFVCLLSACNHCGLVDEGLKYFGIMKSEFGIVPGTEHCVCVVDLLGRSGRLTEAKNFIKNMPDLPNDHIWRSLLAASRTHRNLEIGRQAAKHLLELDPSDDSAYVLLSNVCAVNEKWDAVEKIRVNMQFNKVNKKPACSWL